MKETPHEKTIRIDWADKFVQSILKNANDVFYPSDVCHLEPKRPNEYEKWWQRLTYAHMTSNEGGFESVKGYIRKSKSISRDGAPEPIFYLKPYCRRKDKKSTKEELIRAFLNNDEDNEQLCIDL